MSKVIAYGSLMSNATQKKTAWTHPVLLNIAYILGNYYDGKARNGHSAEETKRRFVEAGKMRDEARADGVNLDKYWL